MRNRIWCGWLVLLIPTVAVAQTTYTWGNNAGTAWATATNWVGGVVPGSSSNATNNDITQWGAGSTGTTIQLNFGNLGTPFYVGTVNILSTSTATNKTLGSNSATAGILQLNGTGANNLILSNASSNSFTVAPNAGGGTGALTLRLNALDSTIDASGTGGITISANVTENGSGKGITKIGSGTLVLAGTNTYSGTTTISEGTLQLGSTAVPTAGTFGMGDVVNNATLSFNRTNRSHSR